MGAVQAFNGTITEGAEGIHDGSVIDGVVSATEIVFNKMYPKAYSVEEDGNLIIHKDRGQQVVVYKGKYEPSTQTFAGEWEIRLVYLPESGTEAEHVSKGHWKMKRSPILHAL